MNRRQFLAALAAGAVVTAEGLWIPKRKLISIPSKKIFSTEPFIYDEATKTITVNTLTNKRYTVLELHRWLTNKWDNKDNCDILNICDETPSIRVTDNYIELTPGYYVTNPEHLTDGSLKQKDELWMNIKSIGYVEDTTHIKINGKKALMPGHLNQTILATKKVTVDFNGNLYNQEYTTELHPGLNFVPVFEETKLV